MSVHQHSYASTNSALIGGAKRLLYIRTPINNSPFREVDVEASDLPILSTLKIHGTSTVSSCRPCRCNWIPSRDSYPARRTRPSQSFDRQLILSSRPRLRAVRRRIREVSPVPAFVLSSENSAENHLIARIALWPLERPFIFRPLDVNVVSLRVSRTKYSQGERFGECDAPDSREPPQTFSTELLLSI